MKIEPTVRQETIRIALGTAVLSVLMVLVFAVLKKMDTSVILGALLGSCAAVGNFFLLALSVQKAAKMMHGVQLPPYEDEEESEDGEAAKPVSDVPQLQQARQRMQLSYTGRMILMGAIGIIGLSVPCFHPIATVLPFLFPRIVISVYGILQSHKKES